MSRARPVLNFKSQNSLHSSKNFSKVGWGLYQHQPPSTTMNNNNNKANKPSILPLGDWYARILFYYVISTCSPSGLIIGIDPANKRRHEMYDTKRRKLDSARLARRRRFMSRLINMARIDLKRSDHLLLCHIYMLSKWLHHWTWSHEALTSNVMTGLIVRNLHYQSVSCRDQSI